MSSIAIKRARQRYRNPKYIRTYTCFFYTIETVKRFKWSFSWSLFAYRNNKTGPDFVHENDDFANRFCTLSRIDLSRCARAGVCAYVYVCVNTGRWTIEKNIEVFHLIEIFSVWLNLSWKDLHSSLSFNFFTWFHYSIGFYFFLLFISSYPPFSFISSRSFRSNS